MERRIFFTDIEIATLDEVVEAAWTRFTRRPSTLKPEQIAPLAAAHRKIGAAAVKRRATTGEDA